MRSLCEQRLAGPHPVAVAAQRVDLAVVGQVAVGVGQGPATGRCWSRTASARGPARSRSARRRGRGRTRRSWWRGEHALVDDGPGRQRREVDAVDLVLDPLAQTEGQPVERPDRLRTAGVPAGRHDDLLDPGHGPAGPWPPGSRRRPGRPASPGPGPPRRPAPPRWLRALAASSASVGQEDHARRRSARPRAGRRPDAPRPGSGAAPGPGCPAPSPVAASAPEAPRWARCSRAVRAWLDKAVAGPALQVGHDARRHRRRARTRGRRGRRRLGAAVGRPSGSAFRGPSAGTGRRWGCCRPGRRWPWSSRKRIHPA